METRRRRREKRARDERRRERKMVEQVDRQYGRGPTPRLRIESLHHFPQCGSELSVSPVSTSSVSLTPSTCSVADDNSSQKDRSPPNSRASSPVSVASCSPTSSSTGLSFAQMLRSGKSSGVGWQTAPRHLSCSVTHPQTQYDSDDDNNPLSAPHFRQSFRDAIAVKFEQAVKQREKGIFF